MEADLGTGRDRTLLSHQPLSLSIIQLAALRFAANFDTLCRAMRAKNLGSQPRLFMQGKLIDRHC